MDAVQAADSGHPGAPMGMAEMATVLWTRVLRYDPADADWPDRDRVVLSNGHASMLLYSILHLAGVRSATLPALTLDHLRNFRQLHSPTAGHPEYGHVAGVETTTGPLGQGIANGVGMALAEAWLRERFGADLVDHHTWVFVGDGCLMEGISQEAISTAGHLGLGRLNVLYDDNRITIDGATDLSFSEDQTARFRASGWEVLSVDGHDAAALEQAMLAARAQQERPTLIRCRTTIGKGSPAKAGTSDSHGAPLGADEIVRSKQQLGLDPAEHFAVPADVTGFVRGRDAERAATREAWQERLAASEHGDDFARYHSAPDLGAVQWPSFEVGTNLATRKSSGAVLNAIAAQVPQLLGGSADLAGSNGSLLKGFDYVQAGAMGGRNLAFGVREHAMGAICNGLALHGGVQPYCATFLVFHDYMRPSVRLASLMGLPVVYVYTHDSVFVGEDGPTHQPIEQLMAMRTIPGLRVMRPADAAESAAAWKLALERTDGPTALALTRQGLPVLDRGPGKLASADQAAQGAYVLSPAAGAARACIVATGSEVPLALDAQARLAADGVPVQVVSMPCWELFEEQDASVQDAVLPPGLPTVSVEAGITFGWSRWADAHVGIDRFGASAPGAKVAAYLGLTADAVVGAVRGLL
ncbi:MAG: transketolase [Alphaproteobacteria bacterium]|nr:transketolase [Alphaproteobacteria bacterium]